MSIVIPKSWDIEVKNIVNNAYKTGSLLDVRKAISAISLLSNIDRGKNITIGVLRTFTIESIIDHINLSLSIIPCNPQIVLGELENIEQELFETNSKFLQADPDIIIILWRLEDLYPNLVWGIDAMSLEERFDACNLLIDRVKKITSQYQGAATLLLSTLSIPDHFIGSIQDQHRGYGIAEIVSRVNLLLYELASQKKVKILDYLQWKMSVGSEAQDKKMELFARQPIAAKYALSFSRYLARVIQPLVIPQAKVLAVDLDNTIWGGVLGEDGIDNLIIGNDYPGNVYWQIQQLTLGLKERGILIVLLSKNNFEDVKKAFSFLNDMPLKLSDFSKIKANWKDKYQNLLEVSKELSLGLDSFVFLDDQLFEQEQMEQFLPEVNVLKSSGDPLSLFNSLSTAYMFDSFSIEQEDLLRNNDYKQQLNRDELQNRLSKEDFLSSLQLKAVIRQVTDTTLNRVVQMLAKTNQFNLTTRRHSHVDIKNMLDNSNNILLTISLRDRFGDQGIVGLCLALETGESKERLLVDSFLISCRALGRGAEDALWFALLNKAASGKYNQIEANYIKSSKNTQTELFYKRMGMITEFNNDDETRYKMSLPCKVVPPNWIDIDF